jgi:chromate transporter
MSVGPDRADAVRERGSPLEVGIAFLRLGLTSFGGPLAHLGYFRAEFVTRRRWLDAHRFAELVSLCQFLPGPTSSQVGFCVGLERAGYGGALAAWVAFTLPSALALGGLAMLSGTLTGAASVAVRHGLSLAAVAVVAQAVLTMARTACTDRPRILIALVAALTAFATGSGTGPLAALAVGALGGALLCRAAPLASPAGGIARVSRRVGALALAVFAAGLIAPPIAARVVPAPSVAVFDAFYRAGALVFGGGHVVLPLLRDAFVTPGWVTDEQFLAGYGAAQAVPGPLFSFAAYLGAIAAPAPQGAGGALLGIVAVFLPGFLLLLAAIPFWERLRQRARARAAIAGVNAAVVGILAAAWWNPVWVQSVRRPQDAAVALIGLLVLAGLRAPPLLVVVASALAALLVA